jgi:hypothetical protein
MLSAFQQRFPMPDREAQDHSERPRNAEFRYCSGTKARCGKSGECGT